MNPKLLMFVSFVFFIGTLSCLIIEGGYFGEGEISIANSLTGYNIIQISGAGVWSIAKIGWGFVTHGIPKLIFWDFNYFQGGYWIVRMFLIMTLSVGIVWGIIQTFLPVAQGILSRFIGFVGG
jgi:hypothetical protein